MKKAISVDVRRAKKERKKKTGSGHLGSDWPAEETDVGSSISSGTVHCSLVAAVHSTLFLLSAWIGIPRQGSWILWSIFSGESCILF